jgi:hypothetical protein
MIHHPPEALVQLGRGAYSSELQKLKPAMAASGEMWIRNEQNQAELSQLITISCNLRVSLASTAISACLL